MRRTTAAGIGCVITTVLAVLVKAWLPSQAAEALAVSHSQNTTHVPRYDVFELTLQHDGEYANPFFDLEVEVTFTTPAGGQVQVGGFHYGSLEPPEIRVTRPEGRGANRVEYLFTKADTWKARFAPGELGRWT